MLFLATSLTLASLFTYLFYYKKAFSWYYLSFVPFFYLSYVPLKWLDSLFVLPTFFLIFILWQLALMDMFSYTVFNLYLACYALIACYFSYRYPLPMTFKITAILIYGGTLFCYQRLRPHTIGMGDIIFISLSGLSLGLYHLSLALVISSVSALLVFLLRYSLKKIPLNAPLPFFPFLAFGTYIAYLKLLL